MFDLDIDRKIALATRKLHSNHCGKYEGTQSMHEIGVFTSEKPKNIMHGRVKMYVMR